MYCHTESFGIVGHLVHRAHWVYSLHETREDKHQGQSETKAIDGNILGYVGIAAHSPKSIFISPNTA